MKSFKEISNYFSEDKKRTATIRQELGTKRFIVTVMNESGSAFSATFDTEEEAEQYSEDWVLS